MSKYVFKPYQSIFPDLFIKEKQRLTNYLPVDTLIEHVGSTAVPNLGGKGIIDIYIIAEEESMQQIKDCLTKAGYEYRPQVSTTQHVFYRIDLPDPIESTRRYHIHLGYHGSEDFSKAIAFRDYLRTHPEEVRRYAEIKQKAANEANQDKDEYMKIKTPVIQDILNKALEGYQL